MASSPQESESPPEECNGARTAPETPEARLNGLWEKGSEKEDERRCQRDSEVEENGLPDPEARLLGCLRDGNPLRRAASYTFLHPAFANIVLALILLNSLQMLLVAAAVPVFVKAEFISDLIFTVLFTLEIVVKVFACGLFAHPRAYFRKSWNVFDFLVVAVSWVSIAGLASNFSVLRVLRPLRSMSRVEGMRSLINALFASIPKIIDNVLLMLFLILTFAILGLQLWAGVLHKRCYVIGVPNSSDFAEIEPPVLMGTVEENCGGMISCTAGDLAPLRPDQVNCEIHTDMFKEEPLNFDSFPRAVLLVFKVVSGDDWPDDMGRAMNAESPWTSIYFILVVIFGSFFATNLFLAVLIDAYYEQRQNLEKEKKAERIRENLRAHFLSVRGNPLERLEQLREDGRLAGLEASAVRESVPGSPAGSPRQSDAGMNTRASSTHDEDMVELPIRAHTGGGAEAFPVGKALASLVAQILNDKDVKEEVERQEKGRNTPKGSRGSCACWTPISMFLEPSRKGLDRVLSHSYTQMAMLWVTLLNVVVLAVDHYKIDETVLYLVQVVNMSCTVIFAIEILLKFYANGVRDTLRDPYNAFDFVLVLAAIPDLVSGDSSAFTALRIFRVLRAVRRFPTLAKLFKLVGKSLTGGVYVGLVMLLQIFIFSIVGMQLFAEKFPEESKLNFDSLWEAAVTCFVIVTGESWATVMGEAMMGAGSLACFFFLLLFVTGNYVLVNVFIAIILDNMQDSISEGEPDNDGVAAPILNPLDNTALRILAQWGGERADQKGLNLSSLSGSEATTDGQSSCGSEISVPIGSSALRQISALSGLDGLGRVPDNGDPEAPPPKRSQSILSRGGSARIVNRSARLREKHVQAKLRRKREEYLQPFDVNITRIPGKPTFGVTIERDRKRGLFVIRPELDGAAAAAGLPIGGVVLLKIQENRVDIELPAPLLLQSINEIEDDTLLLRVRRDDKLNFLQWRGEETAAPQSEQTETGPSCCELPTSPPLFGKSMLLIGPENPVRVFLSRVIVSLPFDIFISGTAALNCAFLAIDHPRASGMLEKVLSTSDYVFTAVFTVEMIIKVIVTGLWKYPDPIEVECPRGSNTTPAESAGVEVDDCGVVTALIPGGLAE
eukprot:Hpha_TRINITY_DN19737_c0_g1::TRINITY_DN19737_c0_g1_i1::g.21671::m.21671